MTKLTVGMAHHTDFSGAYFTIQHIRQTQKRIADIEFVVVDSSGGSLAPRSAEHRLDLRNFIGNCNRGTAGARLIEMTEEEGFGTSQPRNRVFKEAQGDAVVCMDCHVLPVPGCLDQLIDWFDRYPDTTDLYQGPILHDDMSVMATHFEDEWRDEMWGIWERNDVDINDGKPFEIGAMGLGLFTCRNEAWLGFNEHFRAFGGEEWYIHEKFRKYGRKCWCLPWLQWNHRFGRPDGIAYTITREHKVRNYIIGHQELGIPLDRLKEHFVDSGKVSKEIWDKLLEDPIANVPPRSIPKATRSQNAPQRVNMMVDGAGEPDRTRPQPPPNSDLDAIFRWCKGVPRDLNEHLDTLRFWASKCDHVTEFTERRESTIGLLAGRPKKLVSFNKENDILIAFPDGEVHRALMQENDYKESKGRPITEFALAMGVDSLEVKDIEETDLLFIDTQHRATRLMAELTRHGHKIRRLLVVHDTQTYGEKGDDGSPGLNHALRQWIKDNPEWFPVYYTPQQYGLTVLSKNEEDRPEKPVHAWPPGFGPGTELKLILSSVGINPGPSCDCNARALQMDYWGVDGCKENFNQIVQWMKDGQTKWKWSDKWGAAAKMVAKDPMLAFKLNPKDPFPGLIKEAIKRAEKNERQ